MDGAAATSELIDGVRFEIATAAHDAAIRRLLRENPMPGEISVSMQREPSHFAAAAIEGGEHQTIVALQNDRVICAGSISVRQRFVNGRAMRIGYLGGLRLDAAFRGRTSIIRRGYELFEQLHRHGGPPIYLTSLVADNLPARRLLERGLRGMPTYRFLGEFVTLVIRRRKARESAPHFCGSEKLMPAIVRLLNRDHRQYQFAPAWSLDDLRTCSPRPEDFRFLSNADGTPTACAAIWDQSASKQIVVRGYSSRLRRLRPFINIAASLLGRPRLPAIGETISQAFISHLAAGPTKPHIVEQLIGLLPSSTDYLVLGFDARDPRLPHLRKCFRPREYVSRLYVVHWDDGAELAESLDDRLLAPEVATL